jgi:hypothetical protein
VLQLLITPFVLDQNAPLKHYAHCTAAKDGDSIVLSIKQLSPERFYKASSPQAAAFLKQNAAVLPKDVTIDSEFFLFSEMTDLHYPNDIYDEPFQKILSIQVRIS